jgi:hypothetical protein
MLDEREYESISSGIRSGVLSVKHRLGAESRPMNKTDEADLYRDVAEQYYKMTGISDVSPREILRHRLSLIGPPCENCGKELRSPRARKCVECGHIR